MIKKAFLKKWGGRGASFLRANRVFEGEEGVRIGKIDVSYPLEVRRKQA